MQAVRNFARAGGGGPVGSGGVNTETKKTPVKGIAETVQA